MKNPSLTSEEVKKWGYQQGFDYGYSSRREAIRHRDNYTCQCCGKKNCRLEVHHIKFRRDGGTDDEDNLITLCKECHDGFHAGTIELNKKPKKSKMVYLRKEYFIKGRMSSGFAVLMGIDGNKVDFSYMSKGLKTPKLLNCKRVSSRSSCLCITQKIVLNMV